MNLTALASVASIAALLVSLVSLAISAKHYVALRKKEQKQESFRVYHDLIKHISRGGDEHGSFKLVSQLAYIYELRNFPEYNKLTGELLNRLRTEWSQNDAGSPNNPALEKAIDETLAHLQKQ